MKPSRKIISVEKDLAPLVNWASEIILHCGNLQRGSKGFSQKSLLCIKKEGYHLKSTIEKAIKGGFLPPKSGGDPSLTKPKAPKDYSLFEF